MLVAAHDLSRHRPPRQFDASAAREWSRFPFGNVDENVDMTSMVDRVAELSGRANRGGLTHAEIVRGILAGNVDLFFRCLELASSEADEAAERAPNLAPSVQQEASLPLRRRAGLASSHDGDG